MKKTAKIVGLMITIAALLSSVIGLCLKLRMVVTDQTEDDDESFGWTV